MWKMPELVAWLAMASDNGLSHRAEPTTSTGERFGPMTRAAAKKAEEAPPKDGPSSDAYDAVLERLKNNVGAAPPSANGHAKKPK